MLNRRSLFHGAALGAAALAFPIIAMSSAREQIEALGWQTQVATSSHGTLLVDAMDGDCGCLAYNPPDCPDLCSEEELWAQVLDWVRAVESRPSVCAIEVKRPRA